MFKYFNCFFSSFFRTLGRIIVYILLGLVFSTILSKIDVHADSIPLKLQLNGHDWKQNLWFEGGRNMTLRVETDFCDNCSLPSLADNLPSYGYVQWCSYQPITSWYSNNTTKSDIVDFIDTKIPCRGKGWSFDGTVRYMTFQINQYGCSAQGTNCIFANAFTFYQENSSDYYLISSSLTDTPTHIDTSSGAIIDQNNQIINQNSTIINQNQETNNKLNDINSSINDSSSPDLDALKNTAGWLPAGPIDSILNLPLTLLNSLTTNLSKSCTPVELPLPYIDKNLTLPCLSTIYSQIDGLSVWINSIGVIASAFILFQYLMNLYKWVDDTLSFRENNFIDNWTGV